LFPDPNQKSKFDWQAPNDPLVVKPRDIMYAGAGIAGPQRLNQAVMPKDIGHSNYQNLQANGQGNTRWDRPKSSKPRESNNRKGGSIENAQRNAERGGGTLKKR